MWKKISSVLNKILFQILTLSYLTYSLVAGKSIMYLMRKYCKFGGEEKRNCMIHINNVVETDLNSVLKLALKLALTVEL